MLDREEDVVAGIGDRYDGDPVAEATAPACDLLDVEHGVGDVDGRRVGGGEVTLVRSQDQRRHADVDAVVQVTLPGADGVDETEGDGEATHGLDGEIKAPLAVGAVVDALAVGFRELLWHRRFRSDGGHRPDQQRGGQGAQIGLALQVEPRTVEEQARDARVAVGRTGAQPVEPQRGDEAAGGVCRHHDRHLGAHLVGDQIERQAEFFVVVAQIRGVVRGVLLAERPAALAQIDRVERDAAVGEEIGERLMEEVVGESVDVEDRTARIGCRLLLAHERCGDRVLTVRVGAEGDGQRLVAIEKTIGLPVGTGGGGVRRGHASTVGLIPHGQESPRNVVQTTPGMSRFPPTHTYGEQWAPRGAWTVTFIDGSGV